MQASLHSGRVAHELSERELRIINNALNEICHGIDVQEFDTRIGASRQEVQELLAKLRRTFSGVEGA